MASSTMERKSTVKQQVAIRAVKKNWKGSRIIICRKPKKRPKTKPRRTSSWTRSIRLLRQQVRNWLNSLRSTLESISDSVTSLTYSVSRLNTEFTQLQSRVERLEQADQQSAAAARVIQLLRLRLNTTIILETNAGPVAGIIIEVGENYVAIQEPTGAVVLIPVTQINSFS